MVKDHLGESLVFLPSLNSSGSCFMNGPIVRKFCVWGVRGRDRSLMMNLKSFFYTFNSFLCFWFTTLAKDSRPT